jgi:hypothetical protein
MILPIASPKQARITALRAPFLPRPIVSGHAVPLGYVGGSVTAAAHMGPAQVFANSRRYPHLGGLTGLQNLGNTWYGECFRI